MLHYVVKRYFVIRYTTKTLHYVVKRYVVRRYTTVRCKAFNTTINIVVNMLAKIKDER